MRGSDGVSRVIVSYNQRMQAAVAQRLIELNKKFYRTLALPFSATRGRLQPGVLRISASLPSTARVLDLGCGNGNLAARLAQQGHTGGYVGLDFSEELLEDARERVEKLGAQAFEFKPADLTQQWQDDLSGQTFDYVLAFAVLHHIPSQPLRLNLLEQVRASLAPGGRFIFSTWQFLNSERLRERVQPWAAAGLADAEVDPGDYLLDWRSGGTALRYVHQFSEEELAGLAETAGFRIEESFTSDGESGNLAIYQTWQTG
jgi:SAM-dependent methyltransferase